MIVLSAGYKSFVTFSYLSSIEGMPFIFPTDTIYGIGASIYNTRANAEIYNIKKRSTESPLPVLVGSCEQASSLVDIPESIREAVYKIWSSDNPSTIICYVRKDKEYLGHNGTMAIRVVNNNWLSECLIRLGPHTATSVNISSYPPLVSYVDIISNINFNGLPILKGSSGINPSNIYSILDGSLSVVR